MGNRRNAGIIVLNRSTGSTRSKQTSRDISLHNIGLDRYSVSVGAQLNVSKVITIWKRDSKNYLAKE